MASGDEPFSLSFSTRTCRQSPAHFKRWYLDNGGSKENGSLYSVPLTLTRYFSFYSHKYSIWTAIMINYHAVCACKNGTGGDNSTLSSSLIRKPLSLLLAPFQPMQWLPASFVIFTPATLSAALALWMCRAQVWTESTLCPLSYTFYLTTQQNRLQSYSSKGELNSHLVSKHTCISLSNLLWFLHINNHQSISKAFQDTATM